VDVCTYAEATDSYRHILSWGRRGRSCGGGSGFGLGGGGDGS